MTTLLVDVETAEGFPDMNARASDPKQPHIAELSALLITNGTRVGSINRIVKPDGWAIHPDTTRCHGITNERALAEGFPERAVVTRFWEMMERADEFVSFNTTFDKFIMRIACRRYGLLTDAKGEWWTKFPTYCCMRNATPHCRIPAKHGQKYKWPNLGEAYKILCGKQLQNAHQALADLEALAEIYEWLRPGYLAGKVVNEPKN